MMRVCIFLIGVYVAGFAGYVWSYQRIPPPSQTPEALVIFTGSAGRVSAGLNWALQHPELPILISGVHPTVTLDDVLQPYPAAQVPELAQRITLDKSARTTRENVLETAQWADTYNVQHLVLVTADFHLPRSQFLFWWYAPDITLQPLSVQTEFAFLRTIKEYIKLTVAPLLA